MRGSALPPPGRPGQAKAIYGQVTQAMETEAETFVARNSTIVSTYLDDHGAEAEDSSTDERT